MFPEANKWANLSSCISLRQGKNIIHHGIIPGFSHGSKASARRDSRDGAHPFHPTQAPLSCLTPMQLCSAQPPENLIHGFTHSLLPASTRFPLTSLPQRPASGTRSTLPKARSLLKLSRVSHVTRTGVTSLVATSEDPGPLCSFGCDAAS